jgi:hypothetical protein
VSTIIPEEIDLEELQRQLRQHFGDVPPAGYVRGKTAIRAAIVRLLRCSELEAEQLVDTLEGRGLIRYGGDRRESVDRLETTWELG